MLRATPGKDMAMKLPHAVKLTPLKRHRDERGWLAEIFRDDWGQPKPCQWNATVSEAGVLRGMHVHRSHNDYLVVVQGRMTVGLYDIRAGSPTRDLSASLEIASDHLAALRVPTGVIHGFYCHEPTVYFYAIDTYYQPYDELGCFWADPALGIAWPCRDPILSERDRSAGSLAELREQLGTFVFA
jgi:dTDP-4-dehydrorhamnose 3,5-epimerase